MINIYDVNGRVLMQAEITNSAIREEELSKSDYISLSWNSAEKVVLPVGAYIVHTYKIDKVREVTRQFLLLESYEPTQSDEMAWKYTPEFHHPKMILSKIPFYIRTRNSQNEEIKQHEWSFVGTMNTIANKLKDFLNYEIAFGTAGWDVVYDTTNANVVNVSFDNNDFISALTAICNAIGDNCEWHIDYDNEIIYIGKTCIGDGDITLEVGKNVGIPSVNNSKESYYNSFAVFGGTRNITQVNNKGENIASSDIRLQLAPSIGTIDIDGEKLHYAIDKFSTIDIRKDKKEPLFTKVLEFSQIYPSLNTYVYNVRGREKYVIDSETQKKIPLTYNSDGSVATYKTFTVWYMRLAYPTTERIEGKAIVNTTNDNGVVHYWYDFEVTDKLLINGKNLSCSFEANFNKDALSTPLAGRGTNGDYVGFELSYHKEASSSHANDDVSGGNFSVLAGDYEIIYQEDNNLIIPTNESEMIIPRGESKPTYKCNITVLYNIAMAESIYTKDAQKRLFDEAIKEIQRIKSDLNNYSLKSYPQVFEKDNPCLQIGQKVTYNDGNGYLLTTRVLKLSTNIDYNFEQEITIGNEAVKGSTTQLKEKVDSIIASGSASNNGGYTTSQLSNLIAKYGTRFFLSKQYNDTAQGVITFIKGLVSEALVKLNGGAYFGKGGSLIDDEGRAILESLQSVDYDNEAEQGFAVKKENGKYNAFVTNLTIWGKAIFNELEVRKLSYAGGNVYLSGAGSKIVKVVPVIWESESSEWMETSVEMCEGWLCYLLADDGTMATQNLWREGDQVRCKTIGTLATGTTNASNKSYWRTIPEHGVSSVNEKIYDGYGNELYGGQMFSWIVIGKHSLSLDSMTEEFATEEIGGIPEAGDTIVLDGHRAIFVGGQIVDDDSRKGVLILESTGENTPRIVGFKGVDRYTHDGKEVFVLSPDRIRLNSGIFEWVSSTGDAMHMVNYRGEWKAGSYAYYDQVNHNNALWTCMNENGTSQEPSDTSSDWQKVLSGEKGDKGGKGDRGEDGITWLLTPDTLMYDTDDNGKAINVGTGKKTTLRVLRGDKELTDVTIVGVKNMVNCVASRLNNTNSFYISAIAVQKVTIGTDTIDVSCTNGSFDIDFSVDGATYTATAKFAVNISAFTGRMTLNNRQFEVRMTEVTGSLEKTNKKVDENYKKLETSISTTAKSVKVEAVSQTKEDMKAAGLEITADGVDLYGEKVKVKNGGKTAAMFTDGKLNAELIDADTINVHHVWAKDRNNQNTLAHFGNYDIEEAKDESNNRYPIWVGSSTASDAPFKVSDKGYMYAKSGKVAGFDIIGNYLRASNKTEYSEETRFLSMYEDGILFSEKVKGYYRSAMIGTTANSATVTHRMMDIRDETNDPKDTSGKIGAYIGIKNSQSGFSYLYGMYVNVKHETNKFAVYAESGRIVTNDWMAGLRYSVLNIDTANTIYNGYLNLYENNVWFIKCTASDSYVLLPTLKVLKGAIGEKPGLPSVFRFKLTIIMHVESTEGVAIAGRRKIGSNTSYNTKEYPLLLNYDGNSDFWWFARGDSTEIMLYYDGTDYYAQLLTLNR